jgi:hypothetical protein
MKTHDPNRTLLRRIRRTTATPIITDAEQIAAHYLVAARLINLYRTKDHRIMAITTSLGAAVNRGAASMPH